MSEMNAAVYQKGLDAGQVIIDVLEEQRPVALANAKVSQAQLLAYLEANEPRRSGGWLTALLGLIFGSILGISMESMNFSGAISQKQARKEWEEAVQNAQELVSMTEEAFTGTVDFLRSLLKEIQRNEEDMKRWYNRLGSIAEGRSTISNVLHFAASDYRLYIKDHVAQMLKNLDEDEELRNKIKQRIAQKLNSQQ